MKNRRDFLQKLPLAISMLLVGREFAFAGKKNPASDKPNLPAYLQKFRPDGLKNNLIFKRSSVASFYNSKGALVYSGENILTFSESLDNENWVTEGSYLQISSDVQAPDGSYTAGILRENDSTGEHRVSRSLTVDQGSVYTFSIYLKAGTCSMVRFSFLNKKSYTDGNPKFNFNLLDGTITSKTDNVISSSATDAGNGWWRVSITGQPDLQSESGFQIFMRSDDEFLTYKGTDRYFFIWGGQFEHGTESTSYTPTNDEPSSLIRYNYDPESGKLKGFLVEPEATNLICYSENLRNEAAWLPIGVIVSRSDVPAPNGSNKAVKVIESSSLSRHYIRPLDQQKTEKGQVYTFSAYIRAGERKWAYFTINEATVHFNLKEKSASRSDNPLYINSSKEHAGRGWVRCSASIVAMANKMEFGIGVERGENERNYDGDGSSGIYVWGVQLEAGPYASSYIPTWASPAIRSAETCTLEAPDPSASYDVFIQRTSGGYWDNEVTGAYDVPHSRFEVEGASFWEPGMTRDIKESISEELYPVNFVKAGVTGTKQTIFGQHYRVQSGNRDWSVQRSSNKSSQQYRFQVRPGDQWLSDGGKDKERSELYSLNEFPFDTDIWLSYAIKIEPGEPVRSEFCHIGQFHATEDPGDIASVPVLTFRFSGEDDLILTTCANPKRVSWNNSPDQVRYRGKLPRGVWVRNVIRVRFSFNNGQLQWWENGIEKLNLEGIGIGNNDRIGPYWKFGIYRTRSRERIAVQYANMELSMDSLRSRVDSPLLII